MPKKGNSDNWATDWQFLGEQLVESIVTELAEIRYSGDVFGSVGHHIE